MYITDYIRHIKYTLSIYIHIESIYMHTHTHIYNYILDILVKIKYLHEN